VIDKASETDVSVDITKLLGDRIDTGAIDLVDVAHVNDRDVIERCHCISLSDNPVLHKRHRR
jgi:hypothetical protein